MWSETFCFQARLLRFIFNTKSVAKLMETFDCYSLVVVSELSKHLCSLLFTYTTEYSVRIGLVGKLVHLGQTGSACDDITVFFQN